MTREFTGRHMAAIMIAFFGVVIAVNIYMARMAIGTFGGTVVENSYVASQKFNGWLDAADKQAARQWSGAVSLDAERRILLRVSKDGSPISVQSAQGEAQHPLGREKAVPLSFLLTTDGGFRSREMLPAGRWTIATTLHHDGEVVKFMESVQ
jgi:nitrogen fixation protein FixH